jgi:hypothetical protein
MTECGANIRALARGAQSMEEVAQRIILYLRENLIDPKTNEPSCAIVRFFKLHPFERLPEELRDFAEKMLAEQEPSLNTKCLTLLATAGDREEWNDRRRSCGHQAIPLPNPAAIRLIPMIDQLISEFGLRVEDVLSVDPELLPELTEKKCSVFHVPDAMGSPYIPAQEEFVIPTKVRSVLGFGGLTPLGELFSILLFSKVEIPHETAQMFKTIALSVKMAILGFGSEDVFQETPATELAEIQ